MKKYAFLIYLSATIFANDYDGTTCPSCVKSCSDVDQISLEVIGDAQNRFMERLVVSKKVANEGRGFFSENQILLQTIVSARKALSATCLKSVCEQGRSISKEFKNNVKIVIDNPLCEIRGGNLDTPVFFVVGSLYQDKKSLAQINYKGNAQEYSVMLKPPTNYCTENEGGKFNNTFVVSETSLTFIPDESTTKVGNTPTGAQLIKKKKSLPSFDFSSGKSEVTLDLGDDYKMKVDVEKDLIGENNILAKNCRGMVVRNNAKGTSRININPSSLISNNHKVFSTNQYKTIEAEKNKMKW